jgi:hypothetical protein
MIIGAHAIIYSTDAERDRAFLRDVLRFTHVDVGGGWLIFGLPPAEVAVHPAEKNGAHEVYLMCRDLGTFMEEMRQHGIECAPPHVMSWGLLTHLSLPGGGKLGVYEPRHARPKAMAAGGSRRSKKKSKARAKTQRGRPARGK